MSYYHWPYGERPRAAVAYLKGGTLAPQIRGAVYFTPVPGGVWVHVRVHGLPPYKPAQDGQPPVGPHGFHLHEVGNCHVGDPEDPFQGAGGHWNPHHQPHGNHAGDFPVLFSHDGYAEMGFFTNKFSIEEIIGKAVVIHENPDDYRTQPAGNSGKRLACGVIQEWVPPCFPY